MARRMVLSRLNIGSVARTFAAVYAVWGLVAGMVMLVAALGRGDSSRVGTALATVLLYPVGAAVVSAITAWLYNAVAKRWGGISFELDDQP